MVSSLCKCDTWWSPSTPGCHTSTLGCHLSTLGCHCSTHGVTLAPLGCHHSTKSWCHVRTHVIFNSVYVFNSVYYHPTVHVTALPSPCTRSAGSLISLCTCSVNSIQTCNVALCKPEECQGMNCMSFMFQPLSFHVSVVSGLVASTSTTRKFYKQSGAGSPVQCKRLYIYSCSGFCNPSMLTSASAHASMAAYMSILIKI